MKKKKSFKFLSLVMAFLLVFLFAGCDSGGSGESNDPPFLAGVKTLSRPENYDFSQAVGDCTENYYNQFAKYIMEYLYEVYEDGGTTRDFFKDGGDYQYDTTRQTYRNFTLDTNQYYLRDSIRYTITEVISHYADASSTDLQGQTIVLSKANAWNWKLNGAASPETIIFENSDKIVPNGSNYTLNYGTGDDKFLYDDWTKLYDSNVGIQQPNIIKYYYGTDFSHSSTDNSKDFFWASPYYNTTYGVGTAVSNYYQDALEYAIYMTVLGHDVNEAGIFDFEPVFTSGVLTGMRVNGQEIVTALGNARALYRKEGNYVGVTAGNISNITKIILQKVIGENSSNNFSVALKRKNGEATATTTETINFSRNYEAVVYNIVTYACEMAPIGEDSHGDPITLNNSFPIAEIIDYYGDRFAFNLSSTTGDDNDSDLFKKIPVAEYQNLILSPLDECVGQELWNIVLAFEYYELPDGSTKTMAESIDITVGFRYHNSVTHTIADFGSTQITVKNSKNGYGYKDDENRITDLWAGDDEDGNDLQFTQQVVVQTKFNSPDAITAPYNPLVNLDMVSETLPVTALSEARNYYEVVENENGTQHIRTNYTAFSCDYIEIYFVVDKINSNINYAFKVAATAIFADPNLTDL